MRVCAVPGCPVLTAKGKRRCTKHEREADRARGTRHERGYDSQHVATREALLPLAYGTLCPLCNETMHQGQALHLDHSTPLAVDSTSRGDRITHAACNLTRGAGHPA